jgi:hypothetical protein
MTLLSGTTLLLALACNDYGFKSPGDASGDDTGVDAPGRGDDGGGDDGTDGGDPGTGDDTGWGSDGGDDGGVSDGGDDTGGGDDGGGDAGDDTGDRDPPTEGPPPEQVSECTPGTTATMSPEEIYVLSWTDTETYATLTTAESGYSHVYDYSISESGSDQWNESAFLRIRNTTNPDGTPVYANCGYEWLVIDADNYGDLPEGSRIYIGTFWLDAGDNAMTLYHYCPLYRSGQCESFHITVNDDTCDNGGVNSVHVEADGICLAKAE